MRVECATDIGAVRKSNQDSCDCGVFSDDAAWGIVCDGMGGANGGNVASALAVSEIKAYLLANYKAEQSEAAYRELLLEAVCCANAKVFQRASEEENLFGMGTTAVVMLAERETLFVAHVGDSRAYLVQDGTIVQITKDHSYVQNLVDLGLISGEEAKIHPKRNVITRALGVHETVVCDCRTVPFAAGAVAVACSDGLTGYAEEALLLEYSKKYTGKELIEKLIAYAIAAGGSDNITVVVLHHA